MIGIRLFIYEVVISVNNEYINTKYLKSIKIRIFININNHLMNSSFNP